MKILIASLSLMLVGCVTQPNYEVGGDNALPLWGQSVQHWSKRAKLPSLETEAGKEDCLHIWFISGGERESPVCLEIKPTQCTRIVPERLWGQRTALMAKSGQDKLWSAVKASKIWSLPDEQSLKNIHLIPDAIWVVVERRQNGQVNRIAYNDPWAKKLPEHRSLVTFLSYLGNELGD